MTKTIEENERIKRRYFAYLRGPKGRDAKTVNKVAASIARFEKSTNHKPFKKFHIDQASKFKLYLEKVKNERTKRPLSYATIDAELRYVKAFFFWLAGQQGYKSRISYPDTEYFNNSLKNARVAHTHRPMKYPTLQQCKRAFEAMAESTTIQMRDKAVFALFMLAGPRVKAASTLRLSHVHIDENFIYQDARQVETKGAKTIRTEFYPVDIIYYDYFKKWVSYLYDVLLFGPEDPLFPKPMKANFGKIEDLSRLPYADSSRLYKIVKTAFQNVQMHGYSPHNFRRTHGALSNDYCKTPEQIKAWRLNYGHEDTTTFIDSYVSLGEARQIEILQEMRRSSLAKPEVTG